MGNVRVGANEIEVPDNHIYMDPLFPKTYDYVPWNIIGSLIDACGLQDSTFIDVGANIGDSLAQFRRISNSHAICVEPNFPFFSVLARNAARLGNASLINKLLVPPDMIGAVHFSAGGSTAATRRAVSGDTTWGGGEITFLEIFKMAQGPFLLKTDTDGFDAQIVRSAIYTCNSDTSILPVIFFEGPTEHQMANVIYDDYLDICKYLQALGYNMLLLTNMGTPFIYAGVEHAVVQAAFTAASMGLTRGPHVCHYFDIIAMAPGVTSNAARLASPWEDPIYRID